MRSLTATLLWMMLLSQNAFAQDTRKQTDRYSPPLDEQERLDAFNRALGAIDELRALTDKITAQKKADCMKVFGHPGYCDCVTSTSPVGVSFSEYVSAVLANKAEVKYDEMPQETKSLFDNARAARDKCINTSRAK